MASEVLGAVGRVVLGPAGVLAGRLAGGAIGTIAGTRVERSVAEIGIVPEASYGAPIPRLYGRMRTGGSIVWGTPIVEERRVARKGGRTTARRFSASLAVALSSRPIVRVGRIWADGRLIREGDGTMLQPATLRVHRGGEAQAPDPLVVAAEGVGRAPAFRGLAYALFDALDLTPFGGRLPLLSFEVVADEDEGGVPVARIAADLCAAAGLPAAEVDGEARVAGFAAGAEVRVAIEALAEIAGLDIDACSARLRLTGARAPVDLPARALLARRDGVVGRVVAEATGARVAVRYLDPTREFQPGLQQPPGAGRATVRTVPAALDPAQARALALKLSAGEAETAEVEVGSAYARLRPGDRVRLPDDPRAWRVTGRAVEGLRLRLVLRRDARAVGPGEPDAGRAVAQRFEPAGRTIVALLDLPTLWQPPGALPRLWVAACGTGTGWRGAAVTLLRGTGGMPEAAGEIGVPSVIGRAEGVLPPGPFDLWDETASVVVRLDGAGAALEHRDTDAVLDGANLALLGGELIQFRRAEPLGDRRYRLQRLLRGRHGTEDAAGAHMTGERFVLLDPAALLAVELPADSIGGRVAVTALGSSEEPDGSNGAELVLTGRSLAPPFPVHVRAQRTAEGVRLTWIPRFRDGFAWTAAEPDLGGPIAALVRTRTGDRLLESTATDALYPDADWRADSEPAEVALVLRMSDDREGVWRLRHQSG